MSGVYIKGMEMPKACCFCELYEPDLYWCRAMKKDIDVDEYESVSSSCPLIPVPDHGRLIDADAFREEMDKHYPFDKFTQSKHGEADAAKGTIIMMLANAPTIIPADKEGE